MKILFQNENFAALEKLSGWLTTPARFADSRPVLGLELQRNLGRQVYPVHRLDYEVSGLVLFALSARAHSEANSLFEGKKVQKIYQAITENKNPDRPVNGQQFEWKSRILRGKKRAFESPAGKPSLTLAQYLYEREGQCFWELKPVTGRSHQLRFDLSRHGYPIVGDVLYGAGQVMRADEISLKAVRLEFLDSEFCERWKLPLVLESESEKL